MRAGRRKKLLVADMESTIIQNEMLDELADELNLRDEIAAITACAMRGELDFDGAIRERVRMLAGLDVEALARVKKKVCLMPGATTLIATMRGHGAYCALVSGGFDYYTRWIRDRLGFDYDQASSLGVAEGKLTGDVSTPNRVWRLWRVIGFIGIGTTEAITVGDGANDLEMLAAAGMGMRLCVVVAGGAEQIDHGDLTALLYIQGYTAAEFVGKVI